MSKTIQAILDDADFAAVTARAKALSIGVSAYVRMRLHLMLALPETPPTRDADLTYARARLVPELAYRYPDAAPDGTPWGEADLRTMLEVATGLLTRERAYGVGAAYEEGWDARHARDMAADAQWPDVTAARKADRARWEGGAE